MWRIDLDSSRCNGRIRAAERLLFLVGLVCLFCSLSEEGLESDNYDGYQMIIWSHARHMIESELDEESKPTFSMTKKRIFN
jgi:hypothetical protein